MLEMKEEEKLFSRMVSKENSTANPSFRVYYGGVPIGVPFVWEAKPGTPKHHLSNSLSPPLDFPPLTSPPSYYQSKNNSFSSSKNSSSSNKSFHGLFPKMIMRHRRQLSTASTLSSNSSTSTSKGFGRSRSVSSPAGWMFDSHLVGVSDPDSEEVEVDEEEIRSPRSILCFVLRGSRKSR